MVAMNSAIEVDLTGQVCSDSIGPRFYSGVGGQVDFIYGASLESGRRPHYCTSFHRKGKRAAGKQDCGNHQARWRRGHDAQSCPVCRHRTRCCRIVRKEREAESTCVDQYRSAGVQGGTGEERKRDAVFVKREPPEAFPRTFLWGAATSAHQVEGGCTNNNWFAFESARDASGRPRIAGGQNAGAACRHWERFRDDIRLLREMGLNAYRFSVEWSKIEPEEGVFDESALAHYEEVVDALLGAGSCRC